MFPPDEVPLTHDMQIAERYLDDYKRDLRQLWTLDDGPIWNKIDEVHAERVISWAMYVVYCEAFIMPDQDNRGLRRYCMYMRPGQVGEHWIYGEVEVWEQEPQGEPDFAIWQGKFG
jgi:hypothetical protein